MIDQFDSDETIVALATAREPGYPEGIVRLSGVETSRVLELSFQPHGSHQLKQCRLPTRLDGRFVCQGQVAAIPVSVLYWPSERSYTGQPSAEIHAPGSLPLLDAIVQQVCDNGARLANPGEFTLRAFLGGRIDLTRAEAVLGVIDAKDQEHLDVALKQLSGGLSEPIHQSRQELLHTLAHLEAGLDFVEEDIEFVSAEELLEQVAKCYSSLQRLQSQLVNRDQQESAIRLVLFGQPNTGKSSLFNQLVSRFGKSDQSALVSSVSGTTRDFVASTLCVLGTDMQLIDTAGVDNDFTLDENSTLDSESPLGIGQEQSLTQQAQSNLTLFCVDSSQPVSEWEIEKLNDLGPNALVCRTKSDLAPAKSYPLSENARTIEQEISSGTPEIRVSSESGEGIDELVARIVEHVQDNGATETIPSTAIRCGMAVDEAMESLNRAKLLIETASGEELVACEIRSALDAIGRITGVVYTDDILDVVFSQFCIGK